MGYIPEYNTHKMLDQFLINFTIVLQALIDTKFIYDDDGDEGNISDSGIFKASKFGRCFSHGDLTFPAPGKIFSECDNFAFVINRQLLQKPHRRKQQIYNF